MHEKITTEARRKNNTAGCISFGAANRKQSLRFCQYKPEGFIFHRSEGVLGTVPT